MPSLLTRKEQFALLDWIEEFPDQASFAAYLVKHAGGIHLAMFASVSDTLPKIGVAFLGWLDQHPDEILTILAAALQTHNKHQSAVCFTQTITRLATLSQIQARKPISPWEATLVGGIPIANRSPLRNALRNMISRDLPAVVMVRGARGLGHTHSAYLIQHVGREARIEVVKVDLAAPRFQEGTIEQVCTFLTDKLDLPPCKATTQGATVETIATRFADAIVSKFDNLPADRRIWLVFDHLDRTAAPEVRRFVYALVETRLRAEIQNCRIFLLGTDQTYGVEDPFRLSELENLTMLLPAEAAAAAEEINRIGSGPLGQTDLTAWIADLQRKMELLNGKAALILLSHKLVELRSTVGA